MTNRKSTRPTDTKAWRNLRASILRASDICHICGKPGADAIDHVIPLGLLHR